MNADGNAPGEMPAPSAQAQLHNDIDTLNGYARKFGGAGLQRGVIGEHFAQEADGAGLVGFHQAAGEDDVFHARLPKQRHQANVVGHGQAIAERARDGHAEAGVGRADANVAACGDGAASAGAGSGDGRDGGLRYSLKAFEEAVDAHFVIQRVLRAGPFPELGNIRARREGCVVHAAE